MSDIDNRIKNITEKTLMEDILSCPKMHKILEKYNFPCLGCPFAIFEMKNLTIGEICKMYKINLKNLLNDLNEVLKDNPNQHI